MMKILIADDSKTDVAIISSILTDYELLYAYDGMEAMEQMERHPNIDILILDINMPRMNGFEVLEQMKSHPEYKNIAVLVLTNFDEKRDAGPRPWRGGLYPKAAEYSLAPEKG